AIAAISRRYSTSPCGIVKINVCTMIHADMPTMYALILLYRLANHSQNGTNRMQTDINTPKNADSSARSMPKRLIFASRSPCATQYKRKNGKVMATMSTADQLNM